VSLTIAPTAKHQIAGWLMNNDLERLFKELAMT
jgi:hypothetical protein